MSWVKLDDNFPRHPKVVGLSDAAFRFHVSALAYCSALATDGVIADAALTDFAGRWVRQKQVKLITELVKAGLWELAEESGAFAVHDYLEYNPSREQREATTERRREAGREGGLRSGLQRRLKVVSE